MNIVHALQANAHIKNIGDTYTRLYTHNMDVDSINFKHLNEIDKNLRQFDAQCDGNEKLIETLKSSVRAPEALTLKKTCQSHVCEKQL